jgi:hypothetical protein
MTLTPASYATTSNANVQLHNFHCRLAHAYIYPVYYSKKIVLPLNLCYMFVPLEGLYHLIHL